MERAVEGEAGRGECGFPARAEGGDSARPAGISSMGGHHYRGQRTTRVLFFGDGTITFLRWRQPASLVKGELICLLVELEGHGMEWFWSQNIRKMTQMKGSWVLRGECSRRRNRAIVRSRLAKVNVALLSLSAVVHGRRRH